MNHTFIAPHLREHIFRTYEPLLTVAVSAWPEATSFTVPRDVSPATFVANLRNSIVSVKRFSWSTSIDLPKLLSIETPRQFVVVFDEVEKLVWFRSPKKPQARGMESTVGRKIERALPSSSSSSLVPWRDWTETELDALCLLIDKQRITGTFILDGAVAQHSIDQLQLAYNVAIVFDATLNQTVIT